jgi:dihydroflavonol-4-reductase
LESKKRKILLTGASGQLGRRLLPALMSSGFLVRAHYRTPERARKYCPAGVDTVCGDLIEPSWLDDAAAGCDIVIHGAAKVSLRPGQNDRQFKINVEGTRRVIEACARNEVRRLIYISSVVTVGASEDGSLLDENATFNLAGYNIPYAETKHQAEILAISANGPKLQVIVVNPSIMISAPDRPVTPKELRKIPRFIPAYFDFAINVVETEDVIKGILAAVDRGRPGQRYLLTGENLTPQRVFELAEKYLGIKKPRLKIPLFFLTPIATIVEVVSKIKGERPKFHRGLARMSRLKFFYSCDKARRELGFNPKPLEQTIENILSGIPGLKK